MVSRLLFVAAILVATLTATAQTPLCLPDSMAIDTFISGFGVNPLPYDEVENPTGGFQDTACLNTYFETVVQVAIGDTASVGGVMISLDSLELLDIVNLPAGLSYACNPPDCRTYPDSLICATIFGVATDAADIDTNILTIRARVYAGGFPLIIDYPDPALGADGEYNLAVKSDTECTTNTSDLAGLVNDLRSIPNPSNGLSQLVFNATEPGSYDLRIADVYGRTVQRRTLAVVVGQNRIDIDGREWQSGVYLYTLTHQNRGASGRLVVR